LKLAFFTTYYYRHHTHVTVGLYATEQHLRYVEVYLNRFAVLTEALPFTLGAPVTTNEENQEETMQQREVVMSVEGTLFQYTDYGPYVCAVYSEKHPGDLTLQDLASPAYSGNTNINGSPSMDIISTTLPCQIKFDKSTGVFNFPVRIANPLEDMTYHIVLYLKYDPNSINYTEAVQVYPDEDCIPVTSWVINLRGFSHPESLTEGDLLHIDDDIFSQSSSKNIEEELAKTYARRSLEQPQKDPLSSLEVMIGRGSLAPADGSYSNAFMPQERHERVTSYNFNVWFSRAKENDDEAVIIEDIMILSGYEDCPQPPIGYDLFVQNMAGITDDDPKDIGEIREDFRAFICLKVSRVICNQAWSAFSENSLFTVPVIISWLAACSCSTSPEPNR